MEEIWDVVVIGGGPAGLSAALMLGRARRRVLIIDQGEPRNRFAAHMHGVLGHEGTDPQLLLARGREEVARYGVQFVDGVISRIDEQSDGVSVIHAGGEVSKARIAIVASGLKDELPEIPGLARWWGTSVLHCPYCHGWEVRDRRLGVIATSALALHQAQLIRQWSDQVVLFTGALGELDATIESRLRSRGVQIVADEVIEVLDEGDRLSGVRTRSGEVVRVDAIFAAGTARPHDAFLAHLGLERTDNPMGNFLAVDATGKTSSDRIWAVGNVTLAGANVPMSISAGAVAGGMVNMALITEEFDAAEAAASGARSAQESSTKGGAE